MISKSDARTDKGRVIQIPLFLNLIEMGEKNGADFEYKPDPHLE